MRCKMRLICLVLVLSAVLVGCYGGPETDVSQISEAFYEDNGKLYYKSNNKLVEHIYYGNEDENQISLIW